MHLGPLFAFDNFFHIAPYSKGYIRRYVEFNAQLGIVIAALQMMDCRKCAANGLQIALIAGIVSRMEPIPKFLEVAQRQRSSPLVRHGKEFWQQAVRDQETSGLSLSQFCLERGLAKATFFQWRKALSQQAQCGLPAQQPETQSLPGFLAVPLGPTYTKATTHSPRVPTQSDTEYHGNDAKISIKLGGADVVLSGHYADRVMRIITERLSSGGLR